MVKKEHYTPESLQFGAMLAKYRFLQPDGQKLTQSAVASRCNIAVSTYSKYEQGVYIPEIDRVLLLGKELNIPPAELLSTAYPAYTDYFSRLSSFPYPVPAKLSEQILKTISIDTYKDDDERLSDLVRIIIKYVLDLKNNK